MLLTTRQSATTSRSKAIVLLKSLIITAPDAIRDPLRDLPTNQLLTRCCRLRSHPAHDSEHRATIIALRHAAHRANHLGAEADELQHEIQLLIRQTAPWLLDQKGVGPISAAQILIAYSHDRFRSEAAFASLSGAAPIPASSGQTIRYRLNRGGDRQLNRALHTIILTRLNHDPTTRAYAARRTTEGKTPRDIKRSLKRYLARQLYRQLQADPNLTPKPANTNT